MKGESGSAGLEEKPSERSREGKRKVQVEFPEGAKRGPVIGMEDERGGVSFFFFFFPFFSSVGWVICWFRVREESRKNLD